MELIFFRSQQLVVDFFILGVVKLIILRKRRVRFMIFMSQAQIDKVEQDRLKRKQNKYPDRLYQIELGFIKNLEINC